MCAVRYPHLSPIGSVLTASCMLSSIGDFFTCLYSPVIYGWGDKKLHRLDQQVLAVGWELCDMDRDGQRRKSMIMSSLLEFR
eukprot:4395617-Amphidinium_carterae.1